MNMRKVILLGIFILILLAGYLFVENQPPQSDSAGQVPSVRMHSSNGKQIALSDFKGSQIYLHFWASWCQPCKKELPNLIKFAQQHPERIFILISADENANDAKKFLSSIVNPKDQSKNIYFVQDSDKKISAGMFFTFRYPETIIISPEQKMVAKFAGEHKWSAE